MYSKMPVQFVGIIIEAVTQWQFKKVIIFSAAIGRK